MYTILIFNVFVNGSNFGSGIVARSAGGLAADGVGTASSFVSGGAGGSVVTGSRFVSGAGCGGGAGSFWVVDSPLTEPGCSWPPRLVVGRISVLGSASDVLRS